MMKTSAARQVVSLCIALLLATGCPDKTPPVVDSPPKLDGVTVELSAPAELQLAQMWQLQLEEWSASTGAQARLIETHSATERPPAAPQAALAMIWRLDASSRSATGTRAGSSVTFTIVPGTASASAR